MKNNKWLLGGLIGFTVILLATAVWLFVQLKQTTPVTPSPKPKVSASVQPETPGIEEVTAVEVCAIGFIVTASASPSTSPSTSPSASPSTSPEPIACFDQCVSNDDCDGNLKCQTVGGEKRCVNPSCPEDTNCVCPEDAKVCYDKCENSNDCPENLTCETIPNTNDRRCVNSACVLESDCLCPTSASPSTIAYNPPASTVTKGGQPVLPQAGLPGPAVLGISTGLLLILGALLF